MKNIKNKKILPVLIFLFFLIISSNLALAATTTEYWWFQNENNKPFGTSFITAFNSESACNIARTDYIKTKSAGNCYQGQKNGDILVSEVNENTGVNTPVSLTPGKEGPTTNTTYKLLAPLPGFSELTSSTNIGDYFNKMIIIIIGLCAVLAVVMLVVGGVQYMGSESIFGKTDAKNQMTKAIFGLLIAIGAYALLNTINPALLGKNGLTVKQVSAEIEEVPLITYEKGDYTKDCTEGFVDLLVKYGDGTVGTPRDTINICKSVSTKLASMINAAYRNTPALKISGVGSRPITKQESLRAKYCGGTTNIYNPNAKCSQSVAIPGTSNHEKGLAIDITCNGVSPGKTDTSNPCYVWLTKNAITYGFKNNYNELKETWHWSTGPMAGR